MPLLELTGFPTWAELSDLKAVVEGAGQKPQTVRLANCVGTVQFASAAEAGCAAAFLEGFEFTPGYPLKARAIADPLPASSGPRPRPAPEAPQPKGSGKGSAERILMDAGVIVSSDFPVSNCVGAGRIDGWFVHTSDEVRERGWGHLQSFAFEGNLVFRYIADWSPLITEKEWVAKTAVSFEVVRVADGRHQGVHLALPGDEDLTPEAGEGERPWEDELVFELESFIASNKRWLLTQGEAFLRRFPLEDAQHIIAGGPLTGVRDPCKVMNIRLHKAKEALGEMEPYEVRKAKKYPWSDEEWHAWNEAFGDSSSSSSKRKDDTWGNEDGSGCFFGALVPECDEKALTAYAGAAGTVRFVKIFMDPVTGRSKNCGKVFYETPEMAERAVELLHKVEFMGRKVCVEILGDEGGRRKRQKTPEERRAEIEREQAEMPIMLPGTLFYLGQTVEEKIEVCYRVFEELLATHDAEATGKGLAWMVRGFIREVNEVFAGDDGAKFAFIARFKNHQWFWDNAQQLKWQASQQRINLSKVSANAAVFAARQRGEEVTPAPGGFVQAAKKWEDTATKVWDAAGTKPAPPPRPAALAKEPEDKWGPPKRDAGDKFGPPPKGDLYGPTGKGWGAPSPVAAVAAAAEALYGKGAWAKAMGKGWYDDKGKGKGKGKDFGKGKGKGMWF